MCVSLVLRPILCCCSGPDSLLDSRLVLDEVVARGVQAAVGPVAVRQASLRALYLPAHRSVALLKLLSSPGTVCYLIVVAVGPWFQAETAADDEETTLNVFPT